LFVQKNTGHPGWSKDQIRETLEAEWKFVRKRMQTSRWLGRNSWSPHDFPHGLGTGVDVEFLEDAGDVDAHGAGAKARGFGKSPRLFEPFSFMNFAWPTQFQQNPDYYHHWHMRCKARAVSGWRGRSRPLQTLQFQQ